MLAVSPGEIVFVHKSSINIGLVVAGLVDSGYQLAIFDNPKLQAESFEPATSNVKLEAVSAPLNTPLNEIISAFLVKK